MRKFRLLTVILLAVMCAGFISCGNDELKEEPQEPITDEITISNSSFDFETTGGEQTLSLSTNRDWTITIANTANGENWCTVTPLNGKAGNNNIQIRVAENKGYDDRNVSLTIAAGSTSRTIIINQKQQDALTLTANKFEVGKNGGKINVEVKANIQYEVIIPETSKSWISQSAKTRGLTTNNLSFDIAPSEEYDKRTGEIIIKSGELSETVHVYQSGEGVLLLTKSEYSVSDKGETIAVDLKSNFEFDVKMPDVDWVQSAAKTRGMSSHTLYYIIAPNETYDSREAKIIFYDKNSDVKNTLKIAQAQKDAILLGKTEYQIDYLATTLEIEVKANIDFDYEIKNGDNWVEVDTYAQTKNLISQKIHLSIAENQTKDERNCTIIFRDKQQNIANRLTINQFPFGGATSINVTEAGTLSSLRLSWKKYIIQRLDITGELNGLDIRFIRDMAGVNPEGNGNTEGILEYLNLENATIVEDKRSDHYYYRERTRVYQGVNYQDFDKTYYISKNHQIGKYFFKDTKLKSIILPRNTAEIEDGGIIKGTWGTKEYYFQPSAFGYCKIKSITFPSGITYIGKQIFDTTVYLEDIHCLSVNPPHIDDFAFATYGDINITLYVPKGSMATYQTHPIWKRFKMIIEE